MPNATREPWLRAKLAEPPTDDCISWPFTKNEKGYGHIAIAGRSRMATHISLIWSGYPRPFPKACALHSCDNPPCVNPRHLRWGTYSENNSEMFERGRTNNGTRHPLHRITEDDVRAIRASNEPAQVLADRFGLARGHVYAIRARRRWAHVD